MSTLRYLSGSTHYACATRCDKPDSRVKECRACRWHWLNTVAISQLNSSWSADFVDVEQTAFDQRHVSRQQQPGDQQFVRLLVRVQQANLSAFVLNWPARNENSATSSW